MRKGIIQCPRMKDLMFEIVDVTKFSISFVFSFCSEIISFEITSFILMRTSEPIKNIGIWSALYQLITLCIFF